MDSSTATQVAEIGADTTTLVEAFHHTATEHGDRVAVRTKGDGFTITWSELKDRADALAGGLAKLGLKRGDTIALMFNNRPEFHLADLAAMTIGATPFSIYQTYAPEQIQYVVSDAGARIAIIEQAFYENFMKAKEGLPDLEHVIVVEGGGEDGTLRLEDVEGSNPDFDAEAAAVEVTPDDILTLIYTSGTTGPPKGVELTHKNLIASVRAARDIIEFPVGSASSRGCPRPTSPSGPPTTTSRWRSASRSPPATTRARSSPSCRRCARTGSSPCRASGRR